MQQLTDILLSYMQDGSSKAAAVLKDKYDQLKEKLTKQRIFPYRYCEREQFEQLMIVSMNSGKWRAFKLCVEDAGAIIQARKDDQCSYYYIGISGIKLISYPIELNLTSWNLNFHFTKIQSKHIGKNICFGILLCHGNNYKEIMNFYMLKHNIVK